MSCRPSACLDAILGVEPLQLPLDRFHRVGVEQLAQLGVAEQLAQLRLIDDERLRAALGQRRVAVVEEARDVAEEQRRRERRRLVGIDGRRRGSSGCGRRPASRRAPACRRSRAGTRDRFRAAPGTIRNATPRPADRRRACAAARAARACPAAASAAAATARRSRGTSRRRAPSPPSCRTTSACTSSGIGQQQPWIGRLIDVRKPHHEPIVSPERFDVDAGLLADLRGGGHRPRRVDAAAARRQHADAPVAELVAHAFDEDGRRVGHGTRRGHLVAQVLQEGSRRRARRDRVRASADRSPPPAAARSRSCIRRPMASPSSSGRPARSPFQNGILPGSPGAGETSTRSCVISSMRHDEAPSTNVSPTRLSNTISSSSSPTRAAPGRGADEKDAEEPAVGNRAAVGDRDALGAFARDDRARDAVPGDARPQLGELVGGIAARQHVEHAFEQRRGSARRTARRDGWSRRDRRPSIRPSTSSRRSAARRCRAGCADSAVASTAPSCIALATAAHATRSPRNFGKMTPSLTASIWCPLRPMRCSPLATDGGASIWTTRSMAPMSMPSSSDEVATSARSVPAFRRSSISTRCSRAIEP